MILEKIPKKHSCKKGRAQLFKGWIMLYVAKCNLGKVNPEAMLSSCLRMQEACLQPWWFAGTLCDAHMQWAATAGRTKLGVAQDSHRGLSWPLHATLHAACYHSQAHFATTFARKLRFLPGPPSLGLVEEPRGGLVSIPLSPSVWWCPGGWWPLQGYHGYLLPCSASPGSTDPEAPTPKLIYWWWV